MFRDMGGDTCATSYRLIIRGMAKVIKIELPTLYHIYFFEILCGSVSKMFMLIILRFTMNVRNMYALLFV